MHTQHDRYDDPTEQPYRYDECRKTCAARRNPNAECASATSSTRWDADAMPDFLSNSSFSLDRQVEDVLNTLEPLDYARCLEAFPEAAHLVFAGASLDTDAMGVDAEWLCWLVDWLEGNTDIFWDDGEPIRHNEEDIDEYDPD